MPRGTCRQGRETGRVRCLWLGRRLHPRTFAVDSVPVE